MSVKKEGIKTIIFDVNGVLLKGRNRMVHRDLAKKLKVNKEAWQDGIDVYWNELVKSEKVESKFLEYTSKIAHTTPGKIRKAFLEEYRKKFSQNKPVFEIAKSLKKRYKTGILSDQVSFGYEAIKKFKLDSLVDVAVWSQKEGVRKPDYKIYKIALKRLKAKPSETVLIDDREWNLTPAKKLGMKTILFKNSKQLKKELEHLGVKV